MLITVNREHSTFFCIAAIVERCGLHREEVGVDGWDIKHSAYKPGSGTHYPGKTKDLHPGNVCPLGVF